MSTQFSYASGTSEKPLLGYTIGDYFDKIAAQYPDNDALIVVHQQIKWSYSEFKHRIDEFAKVLMALDVATGDRIGIWAPNCSEWVITQFATAKIGAVLVNINPSYRLHELSYALNQSGCKYIILADRFKRSNYTQMLYELVPELYSFEPGKLQAENVPQLKGAISLDSKKKKGMWTWTDVLQQATAVTSEALAKRQDSLTFDQPVNIQYTSGTTGQPKGASLSHHNILNNGYFVAENLQLTPTDRIIIPVPLYHCFGMVIGNLGCVTHGACIIYPSEGFDAEIVLQTVENEKATGLLGVPTMFIAELEHPDFANYNLHSLRTGVMAGALCPIEVMKKVRRLMHMKDVQIAYGMTETSPVSTQTSNNTPVEKRVSTVGKVHPHQEIKIIDPDSGQVVKRNEAGELCTRGYSVMLGYWNDKEQTEEAIDNARWMHTGDLATMDDEGFIKIVGRIKDMIIRGGENIYPKEIEEFLHHHPKVAHAQVIGVPSQRYGEEVMAWIQLKENTTASKEEIIAYCKNKIAYFKVPKYIKFTSDFPLTVTGKVRKVEMRAISIKELHLDDTVGEKPLTKSP